MKPLRAAEVRRAVGVAGEAITAVLDTRHRIIDPSMLNSAGSVSAEWYIETLWHYLAKRSLLQGVTSIDLEFKQPARLTDRQLHFGLPRLEDDALVMRFDVLRRTPGVKRPERVPVAQIAVHRRPAAATGGRGARASPSSLRHRGAPPASQQRGVACRGTPWSR